MSQRYAIILPVRNEAECLAAVIAELRAVLPAEQFAIAVGLNATTDSSREVARNAGVDVIGETETAGYGHGCLAAIRALSETPEAYLFVAADGANDPRDILRLVQIHETDKANFVIGLRRFELETWRAEFGRALPNLILGIGAFFLTGRFFHDLGPLRLIESNLFERMALEELTWGWTIEAQVAAARLGEPMVTAAVTERPRLAGEQKVSGVSPWRSMKIGFAILAAGIRARLRRN